MRVIGKILASIAALAFVVSTTAASAAPMLSVDSQLSQVADKKAEPAKAAPAKAEAKKAEPAKAAATKAAPKKAVKKVAKKKAAKKVAKKAKGKGKTCGVGKYKKGGKCLSAADKK